MLGYLFVNAYGTISQALTIDYINLQRLTLTKIKSAKANLPNKGDLT
jgi:hypothetical protein